MRYKAAKVSGEKLESFKTHIPKDPSKEIHNKYETPTNGAPKKVTLFSLEPDAYLLVSLQTVAETQTNLATTINELLSTARTFIQRPVNSIQKWNGNKSSKTQPLPSISVSILFV